MFWLVERDGRSDWMDKARALGEEFCARRPRNGRVLAGTGYVDDPLGATSGEPTVFRLMVNAIAMSSGPSRCARSKPDGGDGSHTVSKKSSRV